MSEDTEHQFWYNMRTGAVEEGMQSTSKERVGPFATRDEAAHALEKLRANSAKWAEEEAANDR
ncbi:SPOR domain-containing protein [Cryobacterium sp. TMT1-21]|uniref:SPOR domain-containing protein n=1 Tax=Cryobacterium shii TaxID=1259235 RepID=A0AAQ2C9A7_9MICO|nr:MULTISPECIES: SPOR domain-containing protein [Cryobacterium]TFC52588.1 SPOR domain-containing protein [Cryobacterium shii]TFC82369.1 SPOR domain-containing protein [Cryobacterium sp. TmT2-59]TFD16371.1 SPOR domain-containing protein [Cryobacterium sp. TMT1-21]TFD17684.1 SPOR domain-containing protein [Cryobacterium sp. TMT4-10]TFD27961.1 SPOR domain-containing protein [Cryobacterium sp. TMT2-23]